MRRLAIPLLVALGLVTPYVLVHAFCLTGLGGWTIAGVELLLMLSVVAGAAILVISSIVLAFHPRSSAALASFAGTGLYFLLLMPAIYLSHELRQWGFLLAAKRAAPLVDAIQRFEAANQTPPPELGALVPNYLAALPTRLPPIRLIAGAEAVRDYYGNSWALVADAGTGILNFDRFIYLPKQNYPRYGPSGWYQRVGDWAYYHE